MHDRDSKGLSYTGGFFILIAFVVAGLLIASLISIPIWTKMTGLSFDQMSKMIDDPAYTNVSRIIQVVMAVFGFFLPAVLTAFLLNRKPMKLLGFRGKLRADQLALVFFIMIIGLFVSTGLAYFNEHIPIPDNWRATFDSWEEDYNQGVESMIGLNNFGQYLVALFILAFLPALCEEVLFRGGLQNFLTRSTKSPVVSIIIVSILFSAVHASYYGFLSRFFLGIVLGILYQYSGKIWLSIFGHFVNNAVAITIIYIYTQNGKSLKEAINEDAGTYWGILALPIVIGLLVWFYQVSKKDKEKMEAVSPPPIQPGDVFPS